jgi:hypothetical protein
MDGFFISGPEAARQLSHRKKIGLSPLIINPPCGSFARPAHKKGAGISLTRLARLRHNAAVREYVYGERVLAQPMTPE